MVPKAYHPQQEHLSNGLSQGKKDRILVAAVGGISTAQGCWEKVIDSRTMVLVKGSQNL
jgi:hypothetical protein